MRVLRTMTQFRFKYIDTFFCRKLSRCLIKDSLNETRFCLQIFDFLKVCEQIEKKMFINEMSHSNNRVTSSD